MSKIWVTNESSSFARSFASWCKEKEDHIFINNLDNDEYDYFRQTSLFRSREIDIFDPTLPNLISRSGAELIIHQLPIVPEKGELHPDYALRSNIEGTYYVIQAAKEISIPIVFISSRNVITSNDIYDITASTVENILDFSGVSHISVTPPIVYGPEFDEGISGLIKTSISNKDQVVLNLDPEKKHAFMHIKDFLNGLNSIITNLDLDSPIHKNFEIMSKKLNTLEEIINHLEDENLTLSYDIHPNKDYCISEFNPDINIKSIYGWKPKYTLKSGLDDVIKNIRIEHGR